MNVVTNTLQSGQDSSVIVGSGYLFAAKEKDIKNPYAITAAEREAMTEIGYIEANAVLSAASETTDITTANYGKIGKIAGQKEVSFTTGILSWSLENVSKFLTGSKYVETETGRRYYYGHGDQIPAVCLLFVSDDETNGESVSITMPKAFFQGELELDFNNDNPVSFNYAFDLMATVNPDDQKSYYFYIDETVSASNDGNDEGDNNTDDGNENDGENAGEPNENENP